MAIGAAAATASIATAITGSGAGCGLAAAFTTAGLAAVTLVIGLRARLPDFFALDLFFITLRPLFMLQRSI
ncbi:MAG: hypothetical protein ACT4OE_06855 [Sphingosinicella sp.]